MIFWDWTLILLIPAVLLGIYAQFKVTSNFKRYSQVMSSRGLTGAQAARLVLDGGGLYKVGVQVGGGQRATTTIRDHALSALALT